ncbi:right-handed parallel beta-helix repeat-containing protein [Neobacillus sp. M.A.Huq-85]
MTVFYVPSGGSINLAIGQASDGDTILVSNGVFNEDVVINKNRLRIIGEGMGKTILNGMRSIPGVNGLQIDATLVFITELSVTNYRQNGILINTDHNIIRNVKVLYNNDHGIRIEGDGNLIIETEFSLNGSETDGGGIEVNGTYNYVIHCRCNHNFSNGISFNGANNVALDNTVENNNGDGFNINGENSLFINNVSRTNNDAGIDLVSKQNLLFKNKFNDNTNGEIELNELNHNLMWKNEVDDKND